MAPRLFVALLLALALALAGCGDSEDDGGGSAQQQGAGAPSGRGEGLPVIREEPVDTSSLAAPVEGSKRAAPGVPVSQGGDNSIQTWGLEAFAEERAQVTAIVQAFLDARAAGEYALACSYLSGPIKEQLIASGGQARGQAPPDCAQMMRAFTQGVPKAALRAAADINVLSMRAEGGRAFLIYRDGENLPSQVPMNLDGGAWKVSAIAGSALFLGV